MYCHFFQMETTENISEFTSGSRMFNISNSNKQPIFTITPDFYRQYFFIGNVIVSPVICILGICGNIVGLKVLWKDIQSSKQSTYRYMFALMIFDNAILFTGLVIGIVSVIEYINWFLANRIFTHNAFVAGYIDFVSYHCSSLLLIVMSLERLKALIRPLEVRLSWLYSYPKQIIVIIFITSAITNLPFPFLFEVITSRGANNSTYFNLRIKPDLMQFYEKYSFVETVVGCFYPILLLVLNIAIPVTYCWIMRQRRLKFPSACPHRNRQMKVTMLVLWISVMYVLHSLPKLFLQTLIFIDHDYDFNGAFYLHFFTLTFTSDILARLNAANDFLIYFLVSERYRLILLNLCCKCCISEERQRTFSIFTRPVTVNPQLYIRRLTSQYSSQDNDTNRLSQTNETNQSFIEDSM